MSRVSRFSAEYTVSRLSEGDVWAVLLEMSGSNLSLANSCSDDNQRGVSFPTCGFTTASRYVCSVLATCSSAQAEKIAILTITWALELRPFNSPIAADSESSVYIKQVCR